jgi:ATP-binding protein involved in chromosome partitioning
MNGPYFIEKIFQKGDQTFCIEWTDGAAIDYDLHALQKRCPCSRCSDEKLRKNSDKNVRATKIENVGRYALRIDFTSGCSQGIYPFSLLREGR